MLVELEGGTSEVCRSVRVRGKIITILKRLQSHSYKCTYVNTYINIKDTRQTRQMIQTDGLDGTDRTDGTDETD